MDILGKARRLESKIARTLDSAAQRVAGTGAREPLEIAHAIVEALEQEVQPAGRGTHVFPFNRLTLSVVAPSAEARARLEAVFDGETSLRDRIVDRLRSAGCEVSGLAVDNRLCARRGIAVDESGLSHRARPSDRRGSGCAASGLATGRARAHDRPWLGREGRVYVHAVPDRSREMRRGSRQPESADQDEPRGVCRWRRRPESERLAPPRAHRLRGRCQATIASTTIEARTEPAS